ncbi:hypothetical protein AVEN_202639-1 [Araneus ventricosus]|uniref:RNase H type-1 domain-containing protein n=1 Tax=Araneus ventricosus TaxID=182803 RepID=A0A4Y2PTT1_ARAVE|nr:hypothetical protein AVEN_122622-1 [Araneus ventricosus]GBN54530.1 hypothetical protein AVEN_136141-1 [Araneus ventricosus]GBN54545.1 hypothetical protein AVEN_155850-1 [Araneus ventricosus]GBN54555.1 hypothetical protein AVEN_202639-1 [Araneus ventricosus]
MRRIFSVTTKFLSRRIHWRKSGQYEGPGTNQTADNLAKQATIKGEIHYLSVPKSHLKNLFHRVSINKWQQEWATGDTGRTINPTVTTNPVPGMRESILFATGLVTSPATPAGSTFIIPIFTPVETLVHHFTTQRHAFEQHHITLLNRVKT